MAEAGRRQDWSMRNTLLLNLLNHEFSSYLSVYFFACLINRRPTKTLYKMMNEQRLGLSADLSSERD